MKFGFKSKESNMKLLRIGVIAGAHGIVLGILFLMSGVSNSSQQANAQASAGATWSNTDADAQTPTVGGTGFDSRASDLTGYNAGDPSAANAQFVPEISSRQRFEPRRPGGSSSRQAPSSPPVQNRQDNGRLPPLGGGNVGGSNSPSSIIAPNQPSGIIRYTVRSGDSLWGISRRFNVTQQDLQSVNPGLSVNIQPGQVLNVPRQDASTYRPSSAPAPAVQVEGSVYTVKSGDTLSQIAANQGVTVNDIRAANNLSGSLIQIGQKLVIPNGRPTASTRSPARRGQGLQVVVAAGDSVFSIAERYNVTARDLVLHNNLQNPERINPGQTLFIPNRSSGATSQPVARPAATPPPARAEPTPPPQQQQQLPTIPEDPPLQIPDENDLLLDEELIEQPVIPIEN